MVFENTNISWETHNYTQIIVSQGNINELSFFEHVKGASFIIVVICVLYLSKKYICLFSTSVESRTEKLLSVRATNLGQFLSDHFHIAYGTFYHHCECFYRKKVLNRPSPLAPAPFFGYFGVFFSETLGFSPFETFRFGFLYFWHL